MAVARDPVAGSYADMKGFHDRAYSLISEALNIDESGVGELCLHELRQQCMS